MIGQAQTTAWLEQQARQLGYVFPGEKVFVLVTPGPVSYPKGGGVSASMPVLATPTPVPSSSPSASSSASAASPGASPSPSPTPTATPRPTMVTLPQPTRPT